MPLKWTRLSCRNFRDNQTRLQLFALADDLGNFWYDVNADGSISSADYASVKQRLGNVAPNGELSTVTIWPERPWDTLLPQTDQIYLECVLKPCLVTPRFSSR